MQVGYCEVSQDGVVRMKKEDTMSLDAFPDYPWSAKVRGCWAWQRPSATALGAAQTHGPAEQISHCGLLCTRLNPSASSNACYEQYALTMVALAVVDLSIAAVFGAAEGPACAA